jgi:16S rRNA (guanine966-N2)-methyltransferase
VRIVAGRFRGRPLAEPVDGRVRPTSDRVRESVFNIIAHHADTPEIDGTRVIDLFAGTGALGLEALSRGAAYCLFVEEDAAARALIRTNVEALGLTGITKIFRRDATSLGPAGTQGPFRIAFLDPPYGLGLAEKALVALTEGWLESGALVVVEERAGTVVTLPSGYTEFDRRTWGETDVHFLKHGDT